jgi:hypothetical protein
MRISLLTTLVAACSGSPRSSSQAEANTVLADADEPLESDCDTATPLTIEGGKVREVAAGSAPEEIYAVTSLGMYFSTDGSQWEKRSSERELSNLLVAPDGLVLSGMGRDCLGADAEKLRISRDGGLTWATTAERIRPAARTDGRLIGVECSPLVSDDAGRSWTLLPELSSDCATSQVVAQPNGIFYYSTTAAGVTRSSSALSRRSRAATATRRV